MSKHENVISEEHLKDVCKLKQGEKTCAFLSFGSEDFICTKGTNLEKEIRRRLEAGIMVAKGDNCDGK
ncbi:MAG: hypothetical protein KKB03_00425 [Nanoarchaeota archaeon]|nr:hypothetical protein [Nanoarchaeota archaeon]MBU1135452.1 hypothetical protein [Nanoarchaeota archaeon]MBU2519694.1 hypothetical protein [Nanoarchaeota archaeon]